MAVTLDNLPQTEPQMTWQSHLKELRNRLIICIGALVVGFCGAFYYADILINLLKHLAPQSTVFVQLSPGEVFFAAVRLSLFAAVGVSLPVILYHTVRFVSPGLKPKENKLLIPFLMGSLGFFVLGLWVGYVVILPLMITFLLDFGAQVAVNQLSIASFLTFCMGFLFASGLTFQLPLVLLVLNWIGLLQVSLLLNWWRQALVGAFLLSAVITPSADPVSQTALAVVLLGLYGISIVMIQVFGKKQLTS